MNLSFAFAVNQDNVFENRHFGDADKYLIYREDLNGMEKLIEFVNPFKMLDEEKEHGSRKKGLAIIEALRKKNVNVLVSRQFGRNIKLVNRHFIPVIVQKDTTEEVIQVLMGHLHWIREEWEQNKTEFKMFTIKAGILKSAVDG